MKHLAPDDERGWLARRRLWPLADDVVYLNHGSFGAPPRRVLAAQRRWQAESWREPMDFFTRRFEPLLREAAEKLAKFAGTAAENLVFVENATTGMNVVARSVRLSAGDEVVLSDHEYGAVARVWRRACDEAGARLVTARIPVPIASADEVVAAHLAPFSERTRLLVASHITSPTAIVFPIREICAAARARGVAVCVDGPHALAAVDLALVALDCDYYAASCHKWLSAPFGSGFLYVDPRVQVEVRPANMSWGRTPAGETASWRDEFRWLGTRDTSAWLAVSAAIDFMQSLPLEAFRNRAHYLASYARQSIGALTGLAPLVPDDVAWYGTMIALPLPPGEAEPLQRALWLEDRIEAPIVAWSGMRLVRVSCHAYNQASDIDALTSALSRLLPRHT